MQRTITWLPIRSRRTHSAHHSPARAVCAHLGYLLGGCVIAAIAWAFFALAFAL